MSRQNDPSAPRAVIFGCAGTTLTAEERAFFAEQNPLGFILFGRNIETKDQVRSLVRGLRDSVGRDDAPVLIDQEGGRVQRLRPPVWRDHPPAARFGRLHGQDPEAALEATRLNHRLIGASLAELGIDVDCAPVLDLPVPGAHDVIGDRAFATRPETVAALAAAAIAGLASAGVTAVMKHIPGHGRAMADSHVKLPVVAASGRDLRALDFAPFRALRDCPWAMTAHIVYQALDPDRPATQSPIVIGDVIRDEIGFAGVLLSDDLNMAALEGSMAARAEAALGAGCDLVLHCSGDLKDMAGLAPAVPAIGAATARRLKRARQGIETGAAIDIAATVRRLARLMPDFANSE